MENNSTLTCAECNQKRVGVSARTAWRLFGCSFPILMNKHLFSPPGCLGEYIGYSLLWLSTSPNCECCTLDCISNYLYLSDNILGTL